MKKLEKNENSKIKKIPANRPPPEAPILPRQNFFDEYQHNPTEIEFFDEYNPTEIDRIFLTNICTLA